MATYTAAQAAERYGVKRPTIYMWHTRGWLDPNGQRRHLTTIGHTEDGTRLFDEAELVQAEQHTRSKHQRCHRRSRQLVTA